MTYCCSDGDAVFYDEAGKRTSKQMGLARKELGSETIYGYNPKTQTNKIQLVGLLGIGSFNGPEYGYSLELEASADLIECAGWWKDEELGLVMFRKFHWQTWSIVFFIIFREFVSKPIMKQNDIRRISEIPRGWLFGVAYKALVAGYHHVSLFEGWGLQVASPLHCRIWRKAIVIESIHARVFNSEHGSIVLPWVQNVLGDADGVFWCASVGWQIVKKTSVAPTLHQGIKDMPWSFHHCHSDWWDFLLFSKGMTRLLDISELEGVHQIMSNHSEMRSGCNRQVTQTQARNPQNMRQKVALLSDFWNRNPDQDFMWFHNWWASQSRRCSRAQDRSCGLCMCICCCCCCCCCCWFLESLLLLLLVLIESLLLSLLLLLLLVVLAKAISLPKKGYPIF